VGMTQPGGELDLALETELIDEILPLASAAAADDLQGDELPARELFAQPDSAHAAFAELAEHAVSRNLWCARQGRPVRSKLRKTARTKIAQSSGCEYRATSCAGWQRGSG